MNRNLFAGVFIEWLSATLALYLMHVTGYIILSVSTYFLLGGVYIGILLTIFIISTIAQHVTIN